MKLEILPMLVTTALGVLASLVLYILKKSVDEHWPKRRDIWHRFSYAALMPCAALSVALYAALLFPGDEPLSKPDVFLGVLTAIIVSVALMLRTAMRLADHIEALIPLISRLSSRDKCVPQ